MRNHKLQHPITPDSLLAHAIELEEALKADPKASALCPSDGVWRERYEAQLEIKLCMACAAWMQQHRMDKVCAIGPFMSIDEPKKGDKIRVRKGATVRSYHPQRPVSITTREQEVTVDHVINGFVDFNKGDDHPVVHQPEIRWAGAGGYWRWIDPNDMVRPEAPTRPA